MEHLWAHGTKSVGELLEALNATGDRQLAYTTVMTVLGRLHEKGYVIREKERRHFRYMAAFDKSALATQAGRRELGRLVEQFGAETVAGFAADLGEAGLAKRLTGLARSRTAER